MKADRSGSRTIDFKADPDERPFLEHLKQEIDRGIAYMNSGEQDRAILVFKQLVTKVETTSASYDLLQHNLLTAYKQRIEQILEQHDVTPVNRYLPEVFALGLKGELADDTK